MPCSSPSGSNQVGRITQRRLEGAVKVLLDSRPLLPLLLLSCLLLCKNVTSHPVCPKGEGKCEETLEESLYYAVNTSDYIHHFSLEMFVDFDLYYSKGPWQFVSDTNMCHTASIGAPSTKQEAEKLTASELFSLTLRILRSWTDPLHHLAQEFHKLPPLPETHAWLAWATGELERHHNRFLEKMEQIAGQVDPTIKENKDYSAWSDLQSLKSTDRKTQVFAAFMLLRCISFDTYKISNYMHVLQCRFFPGDKC
ncbi:prolactin-like [Ctenodactylus gundi]